MSFAPGKVILTGEHSVVYGYPAIAMPVNLGVTININKIEGPSECPEAHLDPRLWTAMRTIVPEYGYNISIKSTLPMGRGMGSSAALSVALVRAMAAINKKKVNFKEQLKQAMDIERIFHGNPSGLDHTVSALGQSVYFKKSDGITYSPFKTPDFSFLVVDSGTTGSTIEMVRQVAYASMTTNTQNTLKDIGEVTEQIYRALQNERLEDMGQLCLQNHRLLQELGVSTATLDHIVSESMSMGAWGAKLSGSGGGGIVLIFGPDLQRYKSHFSKLGYRCFILSPHTTKHTDAHE